MISLENYIHLRRDIREITSVNIIPEIYKSARWYRIPEEDAKHICYEPCNMNLEKIEMVVEIMLLRLDRLIQDNDIAPTLTLREYGYKGKDEDLNLEGSPYIRSRYTGGEFP